MTILEDTYILESIINDTKNKEIIISLLECLLNNQIKDFEYVGARKLNTIIEYDFSLLEINVILKNEQRKKIYLRIIKGGKIKESIFCYWSLLYEEYFNIKERRLLPEKVVITEKSIEENKKNITLTLNKNFNYNTEIALIELRNFIIKQSKDKKELEYLLNYFNDNKDILFLGTICID